MATEETTLKLITPSQYFSQLSHSEVIQALEKLILCTRIKVTLTQATRLNLNQPLDVKTQEDLVKGYLQLGTMERRPPEQLIAILLTLAKSQPYPILPHELVPEESTLEALQGALPREAYEVFSVLVQFGSEAVKKNWLEKPIAVQALSDSLVNYKSTKRAMWKCLEVISRLVEGPSPAPS